MIIGTAFPGSLNNNVKTFCEDLDMICKGKIEITEAHGNYEDKADEAALYVIDALDI